MFSEELQKIGLNIMRERRKRGWTQEELSRRSGLSRGRISLIECGKASFEIESLMLIAKALGVDYITLLK